MRPRLVAFLVLLLAVVAGGLAGLALDRTVLLPHHMGPHPSHGPPPGGPPGPPDPRREREFRDHMTEELGLSPEQRTRIDSILDRQGRELQAIREEVGPKLDAIGERTRHAMDSVLTPEQRQKMQAMIRRGPPGRHGRGHPPGPPPWGGPPPP